MEEVILRWFVNTDRTVTSRRELNKDEEAKPSNSFTKFCSNKYLLILRQKLRIQNIIIITCSINIRNSEPGNLFFL